MFFHLDISLVETEDLKQQMKCGTSHKDSHPFSVTSDDLFCNPVNRNKNQTHNKRF